MTDEPSVLKAMSDKTRREILNLLKEKGRMSAGDISAHFDMTQATVSHHLSVLSASKLVTDEKVGKYIFYELNTTVVQDVLQWIMGLLKGGNKDEA